jgi:hypothetical protein
LLFVKLKEQVSPVGKGSAGEFPWTNRKGTILKKNAHEEQVFASRKETCTPMRSKKLSRREFLPPGTVDKAGVVMGMGKVEGQ